MIDGVTWFWNGCRPDFPWWCDGFLWMAVALGIGGAALLVAFALADRTIRRARSIR